MLLLSMLDLQMPKKLAQFEKIVGFIYPINKLCVNNAIYNINEN